MGVGQGMEGEGTEGGWLCVWLVCSSVCRTDVLFSSVETDFTALPIL